MHSAKLKKTELPALLCGGALCSMSLCELFRITSIHSARAILIFPLLFSVQYAHWEDKPFQSSELSLFSFCLATRQKKTAVSLSTTLKKESANVLSTVVLSSAR